MRCDQRICTWLGQSQAGAQQRTAVRSEDRVVSEFQVEQPITGAFSCRTRAEDQELRCCVFPEHAMFDPELVSRHPKSGHTVREMTFKISCVPAVRVVPHDNALLGKASGKVIMDGMGLDHSEASNPLIGRRAGESFG